MANYPRVRHTVSDVNVYPGQTITIWLNKTQRTKTRDAKQVELRVLKDGTLQVFSDELKMKSFDVWSDLNA